MNYIKEKQLQKDLFSLAHRAVLEFINMNSRVRRAKTEIHYYDNNFEKGLQWYIDQMPALLPGQVAMEKTPGYFHTNGVAQ